jgi:hypothetical protein
MKITHLFLLLIFSFSVFAQTSDIKLKLDLDYEISQQKKFNDPIFKDTQVKTKSPVLAMIYSLAVPGMGQFYTNRFDVGKYYFIGEAALWLSYLGLSVYSDWINNDAVNFAKTNAGVNDAGKDEDYWINIGIYNNVEQYNNEMLSTGQYDKVYLPGTGFDFYWNSNDNRRKYRIENLSAERVKNNRKFVVGAIVINHIVSAISALIVTNSYNNSLKKSGGFSINADVQRFGDNIHGLRLNFVKWF